jgi:xylan 1,4-beta-xylosidase
LNVFKMFALMGGHIIPSQNAAQYPLQTVLDSSIREQADIGSFATKDAYSAAIMLWNYHDKDSLMQAATIMYN